MVIFHGIERNIPEISWNNHEFQPYMTWVWSKHVVYPQKCNLDRTHHDTELKLAGPPFFFQYPFAEIICQTPQ